MSEKTIHDILGQFCEEALNKRHLAQNFLKGYTSIYRSGFDSKSRHYQKDRKYP